MISILFTALASSALLTSAQVVRRDPDVYGPALEIAHLFYDQWPTGMFRILQLLKALN